MRAPIPLLVVILLGLTGAAAADGELVYPWDNPPPAPSADCLDVPCLPCVFSLPGLSALRPASPPCRVDAPATAAKVDPGEAIEPGEALAAADLPSVN